MVKRAKQTIAVVVFFDEFISYEYLTDAIMQTLGYEMTQAANCASIIIDKGKYIVKTYPEKDLDIAETILELFSKYGIPVQLVFLKK